MAGGAAGGAAGGGAKSDDGQRVKAVPTAGGATRDRGGSGSGGPVRTCPVRFRPWSPSYVSRRRRSGCGAKIVDPDEEAGGDGEAGVVANQDGAASRRQELGKTAQRRELGKTVLELTSTPRPQVLGMSLRRPASTTSSVLFSMDNIGLMFLFSMGNIGIMFIFYLKTPSGLATVCRSIEHMHMIKENKGVVYPGSCSDRSDGQPGVFLHAREAHVHPLR